MATEIDTRKTDQRKLKFSTVDEVLADMQRILEAERSGGLRASGNWTVGQIFQHVGKFIRFSYEGFPFDAPLFTKLLGRLFKPMALGDKPIPPGFQLKGDFSALLPDNVVATEEGAEELRVQLKRIKSGERMTARSPILGSLTQDQWKKLHLKHASHHFAFLHPEG